MKPNFLKWFALALSPGALLALGDSATVQGQAAAVICRPIAVQQNQAMSFGSLIARGNAGGRVAVSHANHFQAEPALVAKPGGAGHTVATFTVAGEPNAAYELRVPDHFPLVREGGGGADMDVEIVECKMASVANAVGHANAINGTLNGDGKDVITFSARLTVGDAQTPGPYVGAYDVVVAYH